MKWLTFIVITLLTVVLIAGVGFWIHKFRSSAPLSPVSPAVTLKPTVTLSPNVAPSVTPTAQSAYVYPMTRFASRITNRSYGTYITPAALKTVACGAPFTGYHTGDDLEVSATELNQAVPVYSIAAGTVRQVGSVSGYGGLIVVQYDLAGQTVTAYYGHINLAQTTLRVGQTVTTGEQISDLGANCSTQTDGERKHLHFALHKGTTIDVRGYAPTQAVLQEWLDPSTVLKNLNARNSGD